MVKSLSLLAPNSVLTPLVMEKMSISTARVRTDVWIYTEIDVAVA
jgi:hypothetical protein